MIPGERERGRREIGRSERERYLDNIRKRENREEKRERDKK